MNVHQLKLTTTPFNSIVSGKKSVESRLFDEKRQKIKLGDTIIFINRDDPAQTVKVQVIGLLHYKNFHDLFSHNDPKKFGGEDVEWLENQINEFYCLESQLKNGVLGIEFTLIN